MIRSTYTAKQSRRTAMFQAIEAERKRREEEDAWMRRPVTRAEFLAFLGTTPDEVHHGFDQEQL